MHLANQSSGKLDKLSQGSMGEHPDKKGKLQTPVVILRDNPVNPEKQGRGECYVKEQSGTLDYPCCRKLGTRHKAKDKVKNKNCNKEVIILHQVFCDQCSTIEGESELSRNKHRTTYTNQKPICTFTLVP